MKLFLVRLHNNNPPILTFGKTRALVGRQMKNFLGPDMVDEVVPVSNQDAEAEYGYNYKQQARFNMLRSESVKNTSMLTGDNPFLKEKMDMKKADMGDVVDDFKKSDAPQFQGKSMAKRRQMAIAAKLQANEEEKQHLKLTAVSEGIDQKLLKQFKAMLKDNEEDSVRLLLQGMPKHTKKMYMSRLGIKESEKVDARTRAFKETVSRLNTAKKLVNEASEHEMSIDGYTTNYFYLCPSALKAMTEHKEVDGAKELTKMQDEFFKFEKKFMSSEPTDADKDKAQSMYESIIEKADKAGIKSDVDAYMKEHRDSITKGDPKPGFGKVDEQVNFNEESMNNKGHYKMTYTKNSSKDNKLHVDVHHTSVDFKGERPNNPTRVKALVKDSPQHREMKSKGYSIHKYGEHDDMPHHEKMHGNKPNITKEDVDGLEERTPIKPVVVDRNQPNLKVPNPNYKNKFQRNKKYKSSDTFKETKEAPAGTYFTRSGQLKKGNPASDGPGGEKLASDPLDKQRKTIVNLKNYPK